MLLGCGSGTPFEKESQPNLVLIVIDALRAENVSFMGYSRATTPNLDALAARSFVFDQAISVGGNTPTSMAAMMTGRHAFFAPDEEWTVTSFGMERFYVAESESGLPSTLEPLAERLQTAGYDTAGFITNPYLKTIFNFHRGFDRYDEIFRETGVPYGRGETVSSAAIEFLDSTPRRPFFLYLHFMDVHGPYWPPETHRNRFAGDQAPRPDPTGELWGTWERGIADLDAEAATELSGRMRDLYDGAVHYVDHCIGEVLRKLDSLGIDGETVVVITSDHGEEFLEHGGTTHQGSLYEELVRVPLVIHVPDSEGGHVGGLVRNFDVMPTLLDLAKIEYDSKLLDAVSLGPVVRSGGPPPRLVSYAGFPWIKMLRTTRYKLLKLGDGSTELYDLEADPGEKDNLDGDESEQTLEALRRLSEIFARQESRFLAEGSASGRARSAIDRTTEEQLRSLGYLD